MAGEFEVGSVTAKVTADLTQFKAGMAEAKEEAGAGGLGGAIGGLREGIASFADTAAIALAGVGLGIGEVLHEAVNTAAQFEQTQTSFGTLLGSEQKAADLMKQIMQFEQNTPFDIGTLTDATKALLSYGVTQKEIIPHLKEFTDMSQGQVFKLNELVSIYGQVNSIQSLNGREVLRLSSIGIPVYQAIADHFNNMGNKATEAGGKISVMTNETVNNAKMSASARQAASDRLAEETTRLGILEQQHGKTQLATEKHDLAVTTLKDHIAEATAKLGTHTVAVGGLGAAAKVTAADVRDMISQHKITSEVFDQVLTEMTSKGGLFFNENIRQMSTFSGIITSVHSQFQYLMLDIMGIDIGAANEVKKGGLFYQMREGAAALLDFLKTNRDSIAQGFAMVINTIMTVFKVMGQFLQPLIEFMATHKQIAMDFLQGIALGFALLLVVLPALLLIAHPMILVVLGIIAAVALLYTAWQTNFYGIRDITSQVVAFVKPIIQGLIDFYMATVPPALNAIATFWRYNGSQIIAIITTAFNIIKNIFIIVFGAIFILVSQILTAISNDWKNHSQAWITLLNGAWNLIKGIFQIALAIIDTILTLFLATITGKWSGTYDTINRDSQMFFDGLHNLWLGFLAVLVSVGNLIYKAIMAPFNNALNDVKNVVGQIKNAIDFTQRHSPSVIDIVQNGVSLVNDALKGLSYNPIISSTNIANNILTPYGGIGSPNTNQSTIQINLPNAIISDQATAAQLGEKIGDAMIQKLKLNIRI